MLIAIPGSETVRHLCETYQVGAETCRFNDPRVGGKQSGALVFMHDIHPYLFVERTNQIIPITFCPYCGTNIEREVRP